MQHGVTLPAQQQQSVVTTRPLHLRSFSVSWVRIHCNAQAGAPYAHVPTVIGCIVAM